MSRLIFGFHGALSARAKKNDRRFCPSPCGPPHSPAPRRFVEASLRQFFAVMALFLIFGGAFSIADETAPGKPVQLRVLSYNIHVGIGMDGKLDLSRTAEAIKALQPDLVALQEVDRLTRRTNKVDQAAELGKLLGMNVAFGKAIDHAGGEYGIAILSKYPILEHKTLQLPRLEKQEDRAVLETIVRIDEKTNVRFVCTHFCHVSEARRTRQAEKVDELFSGSEIPVILAGDFNVAPDSPTIETLLKNWKDATDESPTFGNPPKSKIDYILYRPKESFRVLEKRVVPDLITSDHLPVLSVLELYY